MKKPARQYSMVEMIKVERSFKEKREMLRRLFDTVYHPAIDYTTFSRLDQAADLLKEIRYLTITMAVMSGKSRAEVCETVGISRARISQIITETLALYGIE